MSELLFNAYRNQVAEQLKIATAGGFDYDTLKKFIPAPIDGADAFNTDLGIYSDSLKTTVEVANRVLATAPDDKSREEFKTNFLSGMVELKVLAEKITIADGFAAKYDAMATFEKFKENLAECRQRYAHKDNGVYISNVLPPPAGKTKDGDGGKKQYVKEVIAGVAIGVLTFVGIVLISVFLPTAEIMAIANAASSAGLGLMFV